MRLTLGSLYTSAVFVDLAWVNSLPLFLYGHISMEIKGAQELMAISTLKFEPEHLYEVDIFAAFFF